MNAERKAAQAVRKPGAEDIEMIPELVEEFGDYVEITRNEEGKYGWRIKQYYSSPDETIDDIIADIVETDKQLREAFL